LNKRDREKGKAGEDKTINVGEMGRKNYGERRFK